MSTFSTHFSTRTSQTNNGEIVGYRSGVNTGDGDNVFNFYAAGDAPNYFEGLTEHASGVNVIGFQQFGTNENSAVLSNYSFEGAGGQTLYGTYHYLAATSKQANVDGHYVTGNLATTNKATGIVSGFNASGGLVNSSDTLTAGFYSNLPIGDGTNYNFYAAGMHRTTLLVLHF